MQISIYNKASQRKVIGNLREDGVFTKHVKESKHLFRKLDAWGIDGAMFKKLLLSKQCHVILVIDDETGKKYMTTPQIMDKYGDWRTYGIHKPQIFLARRYWAQDGDILSPDRIKEILKQAHIGT